jgi:HAD superfamily hydrolase (TIGR01490 family)
MPATTRSAAFFDIDGTLTDTTTMFDFLAHHLAAHGRSDQYTTLQGQLRAMAQAGADRADRCRAYYQVYAGVQESSLMAEGERWFCERITTGGFLNPSALAAYRAHAVAGDLTVLVSGSFPACLQPLAEYLGADVLLCSRPEVRGGRYTGAITNPMIGAAKAEAVARLATERALSLKRSHAYGDHLSDVAFMELVGSPVVVGHDPLMRRHAAVRGWRCLDPASPSEERQTTMRNTS